jgi:hypothetical protein
MHGMGIGFNLSMLALLTDAPIHPKISTIHRSGCLKCLSINQVIVNLWSMFRFLLYALLIWFLYNLIFKLIIPLYRTTRHVKKKFREMHKEMEEQNGQSESFQKTSPTVKPKASKRADDYIDFEEIK